MEQKKLTDEQLEQNVRDRVSTATRRLCTEDPREMAHLDIFAAYCIMRSVERQEELMQRMEKQQKVMTILTIAIAVLTAAVVALAVLTAFPNIANKLTG